MSVAQEILKTEKKLSKEIESLKEQIKSLENNIGNLKQELGTKQALLDQTLGFKEMLPDNQIQKTFHLQQGSELAKVRDLIKQKGCPLYVSDILDGLGLENSRNKRSSLGGSLNSYAREEKIFKKTAPNTFGLIGVDYNLNNEKEEDEKIRILK